MGGRFVLERIVSRYCLFRHGLFIGLCLLNTAVQAAEPPRAAPPITWNDCVSELIRNNPQLQAAGATVEKARTDVMGNYGPFLPQVSANAAIGKSNTELDTGYQDSTSYLAALSANQTLFAGFNDLAALRRSQALLTGAEVAFQTTKSALSAALRQSFAQLLFAQDFTHLSDDIAARRKANVNLVEMRFQAGRENKGSFLLSKAYYSQALFSVTQAQRNLKAAQQQMAATLGRHEIAPLAVTGAWTTVTLPAKPNFTELAMQTPSYRQAAAQVRAAKEGVRIAKSVFYPTLAVNGSIGRSDDDSIIPKNDQWSVGASLSYPLFSGGRDWHTVRGTQATQRFAEKTLDDTLNQTIATLESAFATWQNAVELTGVQTEFLNAAEVRSEIARAQYQNGLLSFSDWDLVENDLISKQNALLASQRDAVLAQAGWEQALGTGVIP
ncbi:MAG: TolC family protein [Kiritimatiellia bacterium]|jgi:outer membrane protein TolC